MLKSWLHRYRQLPRLARATLPPHILLAMATAPTIAMVQYAPYASIKIFRSPGWVPILAASFNAVHLMALLFTDRIQRSDKIAWIVWPNLVAFAAMACLWLVNPGMSVFFGLMILFSQLCRTPVISAQTALYRSNYPATVRSQFQAIALSCYTLALAAYALGGGWLLERSEGWIGSLYAGAGLIGMLGCWHFARLRRIQRETSALPLPRPAVRYSMLSQIAILRADRPFRNFQISQMFFGAGNIALLTIFPLYLDEQFRATHEQASLAINVIPMFTSTIMLPLWGTLLDRRNPLLVYLLTNVVMTLAPLIYFLTPTLHGVYWAVFMLGLVQGGNTLIWYLVVNYYARAHDIVHYMGLHQTLTGVRGLLMPFVAAGVAGLTGSRNAMLLCLVLMAVGCVQLAREIRRERRLGRLPSFQQKEEAEETRGSATYAGSR